MRDWRRQGRGGDDREEREKPDVHDHERGANEERRGPRPSGAGRGDDRQADENESYPIGAGQVEAHRLPFVQRLEFLRADDLEGNKKRLIAVGRHARGREGRQKRQPPFRGYSQALPWRSRRNGLETEQDRENEGDRKARMKIGPKRHQEREPPRRFSLLDRADEAADAERQQEIEENERPGEQIDEPE